MRAYRRGRAIAIGLATTLALGACAGDDGGLVDDARPAQEIFDEAEAEFADADHVEAAETYAEVERLYPYSQLAKRAMLRSAEAYYEGRAYNEARLAAQRYLDFFPSDANAPQAQYIVALSHYDQISDVGRDQGQTFEALQALRETINRYPQSAFVRDAQLKLDLTVDHLAGKEMQVGRYYLGKGHYVAAINRFNNVVQQYDTTSHTPEALHRLVEAYLALGVEREAQTAAAVLGHNFPGSDWYVDSYALLTGERLKPTFDPETVIGRIYRQVVEGDQF